MRTAGGANPDSSRRLTVFENQLGNVRMLQDDQVIRVVPLGRQQEFAHAAPAPWTGQWVTDRLGIGLTGSPELPQLIGLALRRNPRRAHLLVSHVLGKHVPQDPAVVHGAGLALGRWRVLFHHVLPNCMAPIIITSTLSVSTSILIESSLSFLGLGTQPPTPSWGWDLKANLVFIDTNPWIVVFPGVAIFLTTLAFNMLGDGLRDALDPRLKT